jgi:predicted ribosomally synthesized peptide with nif11-like leader
MSVASAKKFMDKVEADKKVRAEIKKSGGDFMKVAKSHRHSFTKAELRTHLKKRWAAKKPAAFDDADLTCLPA